MLSNCDCFQKYLHWGKKYRYFYWKLPSVLAFRQSWQSSLLFFIHEHSQHLLLRIKIYGLVSFLTLRIWFSHVYASTYWNKRVWQVVLQIDCVHPPVHFCTEVTCCHQHCQANTEVSRCSVSVFWVEHWEWASLFCPTCPHGY